MNQWTFVAAAYGLFAIAIVGLVFWAWQAMRRAETELEALKRRP